MMEPMTRDMINTRAEQANVTDRYVEPCQSLPPYVDSDHSVYYCTKSYDHVNGKTLDERRHRWTELKDIPNLYTFTITCDNSVEEEFQLITDYEVNIADWIAEDLQDAVSHDDIESWEVKVAAYRFSSEEKEEVKYAVRSGEIESHDYEPGDEHRPMYTDPMCRICGEPRTAHQHG